MQSQTTVMVRTAGQPKRLISDQMGKMRMWLDNRGICLAGFAPVPLGDNEVAFDAYFTDPEQADLFRAVFGQGEAAACRQAGYVAQAQAPFLKYGIDVRNDAGTGVA